MSADTVAARPAGVSSGRWNWGQVMERSVRMRGVGLAAAALAAAAMMQAVSGVAAAVPIRAFTVQPTYDRVEFRAVVMSPPTAKSCRANVHAAVFIAGGRRIKALGNHRISVCQGGNRGWTSGGLDGHFGMGNIRAGNYDLCLRAVQVLRNGRNSAHTECGRFWWPGS